VAGDHRAVAWLFCGGKSGSSSSKSSTSTTTRQKHKSKPDHSLALIRDSSPEGGAGRREADFRGVAGEGPLACAVLLGAITVAGPRLELLHAGVPVRTRTSEGRVGGALEGHLLTNRRVVGHADVAFRRASTRHEATSVGRYQWRARSYLLPAGAWSIKKRDGLSRSDQMLKNEEETEKGGKAIPL